MIAALSNWPFNYDQLAVLMMALVVFTGICVGSFAYRHLKGDIKYTAFFAQLVLLVVSVCLMVGADSLILLFISWSLSNILLVRLMIHKARWKAARASGILAAINYLFGAFCLATAFALLYWLTGETSIQAIIHQDINALSALPALALLLLGAMTQSAIWPFNRWLLSSLNSPTVVSAIMHAGLVNGGGFLLTRFAPLYLKHPQLLTVIFVIGTLTALLGTLWKLMQNDVKRMLACSTMGQMGFMFAQCGLGLFPAAVAHLIWHGMFKAYLFLASGGSAQEKRLDLNYPPKPFTFIGAIIGGMLGSFCFAFASNKSWLSGDTTLVLLVISWLACSQFALSILQHNALKHFALSLVVTSIIGLIYGYSVNLMSWVMQPMHLMQPQPLNGFYIAGSLAMTLAWLAMVFTRGAKKFAEPKAWMQQNYVAALNASQPHPDTVTTHRKDYQYL